MKAGEAWRGVAPKAGREGGDFREWNAVDREGPRPSRRPVGAAGPQQGNKKRNASSTPCGGRPAQTEVYFPEELRRSHCLRFRDVRPSVGPFTGETSFMHPGWWSMASTDQERFPTAEELGLRAT